MRTTPNQNIRAGEPSRAEQDYLKVIYRLGGADQKVPPMKIANLLSVRAPSVTGMLKRIKAEGWISYEPGNGARLTPTGITEARRVIRRRHLMEVFLERVLGLGPSEVEAEAEDLEHAVSPRLEHALARYLGTPLKDKHGDAIPTRKATLEHWHLRPLNSFRPGERVIIREADNAEPKRSRQSEARGMRPGTTVLFLSYQPNEDLFQLEVNANIIALRGEELAAFCGELVVIVPSRYRKRSVANSERCGAKC